MIKLILKLSFAIALVYWLISTGKLDLTLVRKSFDVGYEWLIAFCLVVIQVFIGTFRYKILLETNSSKKLAFFEILKLNYIGLFFSSVLPGAVTGDIIKLVYVKKLDSHFTKTFLVTATLLDRIIGLAGLLFMAGFFSLFSFSEVSALSSKMAHLILVNLFLFSGTVLFLSILVGPATFQKKIIRFLNLIPFIGKKITHLLKDIFALREKKKDLLKCFLLSITAQFLGILAFWIMTSPFYQTPLPLKYAFTFIPIGLIATAIPISPGGLGVGHVFFANLFSFVNINNGASLFNLFFLCNFLHNFLGVIPYLLIGKNAQKH